MAVYGYYDWFILTMILCRFMCLLLSMYVCFWQIKLHIRYDFICMKLIRDRPTSWIDGLRTLRLGYLRVVHGLGRPTGWVGSRFLAFWWVGLGRGSETFSKILKLGRSFVTAELIPDNLIMINE